MTVADDQLELDPDLLFGITAAGRRQLAEAAIRDALEAIPGFDWHPDDLADAAHAAAVAAWRFV